MQVGEPALGRGPEQSAFKRITILGRAVETAIRALHKRRVRIPIIVPGGERIEVGNNAIGSHPEYVPKAIAAVFRRPVKKAVAALRQRGQRVGARSRASTATERNQGDEQTVAAYFENCAESKNPGSTAKLCRA